jgi:hypothetical protein|nr:MAG TPA: hypothetical protein [Caudoviricetes sp.]
MSKFIQKDRQLNVPKVFDKDRDKSEYMIIKIDEFKNLIERSRSFEKSIAVFENVTIGVILIITGIIIGIGIVGL